MAEMQNQNQNEQQNAQVENKQQQPSKFKKFLNGAKKVGVVVGLVGAGAYIESKTGVMGKTIAKFKNRKEETVQQSFQIRHQGQTFNKGGQR